MRSTSPRIAPARISSSPARELDQHRSPIAAELAGVALDQDRAAGDVIPRA